MPRMPDDFVHPIPVGVREYIDARFDDHHREHAAEHRALDAAASASSARFKGVTEFRAALSDQVGTFVTRATLDAIITAQEAKLDAVAATADRTSIASGVIAGIAGLITGAILLLVQRGAT